MISRAIAIGLLAPAVLLAGCQGFMHGDSNEPAGSVVSVRNKGYALLYSTIDAESQVAQVLLIKNPSPPVAELIKAIAQFSHDTKDKLQALAKEDPTLNLDSQGLPEVETTTRDAISAATAKHILHSGGKDFEFRILLTQHEALDYITHLAGSLSKQESREVRKRYLVQLAVESNALHERVIAQLEAPYVGRSK